MDLRETARSFVAAGLSVAPASPQTKFTTLARWKTYQQRRMTARQIEAQFADAEGVCIICGKISENLEMIDFDQKGKVFAEWAKLVEEKHPGILASLVIERSQSGGMHVYYRTETPKGNVTLAVDDGGKLIETRGEGGLVVCWPTPGYDVVQGQFTDIPVLGDTLRNSLFEIAKTFDRREKPPTFLANGNGKHYDDGDGLLDRVRKYLDKCPEAISGQRGHDRCFAVVRAVVHGFGLDEETAMSVLSNWNASCDPPWSEKELRHKIQDAKNKPSTKPYGWLRDAQSPQWAEDDLGVDLSDWGKPQEDAEETIPGIDDPGALPERLLRVPGFIEQVVEFNLATAHRRQPVLALAAAISLQAVLAGRKVRDYRDNRTNLYVIGVSDSGSGKDHARKVNSSCLFHASADTFEGPEEIASDAGLINTLEVRPSLLLQVDEFGKFLRTLSNPSKSPHLYTIISTLLKLYSSANRVFQGKAYADQEKNKKIDQPNLVLHGTGNPSDFFESLTPESLRDGLVGRFLVFEGQNRAKREEPTAVDPPKDLLDVVAWWRDFKPGGNLASVHPQPLLVDATAEARSVFADLGAIVDGMDEEEGGWERGVWARAEEKACRLALVYACSREREGLTIDKDAAQWACDVAEHMTRRLIYLGSSHVSDNAFDGLQKRVMNRVRKNGGGISQSQFVTVFAYWDKELRSKILANLLETKQLFRRSFGEGPKKGMEYVVSSQLHTAPGTFRRKS